MNPGRIAIARAWTAELPDLIGALWCRLAHRSLSRPVRSKYRCWKCLREYDIPW